MSKIVLTVPTNRIEIQSACALRTGEFVEEYDSVSYVRKFAVNQVEETPYSQFDDIANEQNDQHVRESSGNLFDRR